MFTRLDSWITASIFAAALIVAYGLGWWHGRRKHRLGKKIGTGKMEDASLALLGLLLAFTFSMSLGKHEQRRMMVINDANSIGDFYTCVSLLNDPIRGQLQSEVRHYTESRVNLGRQISHGAEHMEVLLDDIAKSQSRMTNDVRDAVREGTPIAISLTNTLNEVTTSNSSRIAALEDRLPTTIVVLLFVAGTVAIALLGEQAGHAGRTHFIGTLAFTLLVSLVVYVIMDLNQPAHGLIQVSQQPLERLLQSMNP